MQINCLSRYWWCLEQSGMDIPRSTVRTYLDANQPDSALLTDLRKSEGYVDHYVKVPLKQYQFDALVSWTFNLGSGNLRSSTLLKKLNKRLYNEVPKEIERWNKVNGRVLLGLQRRRSAEALLFQGKNWRNYQKYF